MKPNKTIAQNQSSEKGNRKLMAKLLSFPVEQKACLFILFMGIIGGVVGGAGSELEMRALAADQRLPINVVEQRMDGVETGAYAGMGAAAVMSLSALVKYFKR